MPDGRKPLTRADFALVVSGAFLVVLLWALRNVVLLVVFAVLLAYILGPIVDLVERAPLPRRRRVPRPLASLVVILALGALLAWAGAYAVPVLVGELVSFAQGLPDQLERLVDDLRTRAATSGSAAQLGPLIEGLRANARALLPQLADLLVRGVAGLFASLDQILGLALLPMLTYYLLADGDRVRDSLVAFLPEETRGSITASRGPVHRALRSYVRGQALVCLVMGVVTGAALALAGVPNALFLSVLVALAEVIPIVGAFIAGLAIALSGLSVDPGRAAIGVGLYVVINWLLGALVTPRAMGRYLKLHPFLVIVSVLAGTQLLGAPGAIAALPAAAVGQALVEDLAVRRRIPKHRVRNPD